jgi:Tol biopolymer transport system component
VAQLAPELAAARLITLDDSAGRPVLFASRLDGGDRTLVWDSPNNWPGTLVGDDGIVIAAPRLAQQPNDQLALFSMAGQFRRNLSNPPPRQSDASPSYASGSQTVYFIRNTWRDTGGGSSTLESSRLMRLQLTGGQAQEVRTSGAQFRTVSASQDGRVVAGQCVTPGDNPSQGCVVDLSTGRIKPIPSPGTASMDDINISPDGRWVAYSSPFPNPYGQTQLYVYDRQADAITRVTSMAGMNGEPAWVPSASTRPCLAFSHYERTKGSSVQLLCLSPEAISVQAMAIGSWPIWLPSNS